MKPNFKKLELIPAIIQEYKTKEILMLAYVNEESYEYMLENKRTCFFNTIMEVVEKENMVENNKAMESIEKGDSLEDVDKKLTYQNMD